MYALVNQFDRYNGSTFRSLNNYTVIIILFCLGTGKTTVGVHLAYSFAKLNQIAKKKAESTSEKTRCVVYCSASDSSLDVVASTYVCMLNKNTLCAKKLQGQLEAAIKWLFV